MKQILLVGALNVWWSAFNSGAVAIPLSVEEFSGMFQVDERRYTHDGEAAGAHTEVVNNLVHGEILLEGGEAELRTNLTGKLEHYWIEQATSV